jgi:hypothetical protein
MDPHRFEAELKKYRVVRQSNHVGDAWIPKRTTTTTAGTGTGNETISATTTTTSSSSRGNNNKSSSQQSRIPSDAKESARFWDLLFNYLTKRGVAESDANRVVSAAKAITQGKLVVSET